jgi:hypothetical protein
MCILNLFVLDQPFYFVGDELIKELNIDKKSLASISTKPNPNLFQNSGGGVSHSGHLDLPILEVNNSSNFNHLTDYSFVKNDVFSGIDWIYTFVESMYAYNFRIFYYKYHNTFFEDSCDYCYNLFWFFTLSSLSFQLL